MLKTPSLHDLIPALDDSDLHLLQNPDGNPVWLESITAIPSDSYADDCSRSKWKILILLKNACAIIST
jgi:hypothetical protein